MASPKELDDFEFQLRAQKEFGAERPGPGLNDVRTYVDPNDGTVYEWDSERRGWFPKIDDDFLAAYQANYGLDNATPTETTPTGVTPTGATTKAESSAAATGTGGDERGSGAADGKEGTKEDGESADSSRKRKQEPGWFEIDETHNHNVYVSGLPLDVTVDEFTEVMSKCGIIANDDKGEPKLKLYSDVNGQLKGDGLCCYLKVESVDLAIQLLDQSNHRGHTITVERAKFQMKGGYNRALKKKKKGKKRGGQERLLDWKERHSDGPKSTRSKYDKVIIFKNLFEPKEFEEDSMAINDIRDDLREECEKFGVVRKVLLFDRHPDGVGSVAFKEFESADMCVLQMNNRWYGGKQLDVATWDGATNYQIEETDQEREQRLEQWENFLEEGGVNTKEGGAKPDEGGVKVEKT